MKQYLGIGLLGLGLFGLGGWTWLHWIPGIISCIPLVVIGYLLTED